LIEGFRGFVFAYSPLPSVTIFPIIEPLQKKEVTARVIDAVREAVKNA